MMDHDVDDLKQRFAGLRRETAAGLPSFHETVTTARARGVAGRRRRRVQLAAVVTAGLALAVLVTRRGRPDARMAIDPATVRWHAPTDFLLTLPGTELLRSVPRLGRLTFDGRTL